MYVCVCAPHVRPSRSGRCNVFASILDCPGRNCVTYNFGPELVFLLLLTHKVVMECCNKHFQLYSIALSVNCAVVFFANFYVVVQPIHEEQPIENGQK
jgi:hypothetical protein